MKSPGRSLPVSSGSHAGMQGAPLEGLDRRVGLVGLELAPPGSPIPRARALAGAAAKPRAGAAARSRSAGARSCSRR